MADRLLFISWGTGVRGAPLGGSDSRRLASLLIGACWPGGPEDRTERVALEWLRRWHPERIAAPLPACSCDTGHCVLCN